MRRALILATIGLWLPLAAHGQPIAERLFELQYFPARTAHLCGVTTEAEALRLSAAIAADYAAKTNAVDGRPTIPLSRLNALRARLDARKPTPQECESAPRYVPVLQADYPPGGKVERNPPGSAAWTALVQLSTNAHFIARARACNLITADTAASLLKRAESLPVLTFHWTAAELADASAQGVTRGRRQGSCQGAADTLALVVEKITEAETDWKPAD